MLENMIAVLSRIEDIKARFRANHTGGVVSIAPHYSAQPRQSASGVKPFFPAHLIDAVTKSSPERLANTSAYDGLIDRAAARHGVDSSLIKAIIQAESGFNPAAVSSKGARGLMQLMPGTAAALGVGDAFDPAENIEAGTRYLKQQLDRFGDTELALAAYNAGPGAVVKYGGVPPFLETRGYVGRVLSYRDVYSSHGG